MPESKKLSELIDDFIDVKKQYSFYLENPQDVPIYVVANIRDNFKRIQNQIDQKFEELRCECKKNKEWEVKEIHVPTANKKIGYDHIKSILVDGNEECCMMEGLHFEYQDGKVVIIRCSKHRYAKNPHQEKK